MLRPLADLHTHTTASGHAYSTISELAATAAARGLELIAVTDHGPSCPGAPHPWHFLNMKVVPSVIGGVRVLKGVEADPVPDTANGIDLEDAMWPSSTSWRSGSTRRPATTARARTGAPRRCATSSPTRSST